MTKEDIRRVVWLSYKDYSDEALRLLMLNGHDSCGTNHKANEGFYAAEMLIERLKNKIESFEDKIASKEE